MIAYDCETYQFRPGLQTPKGVVGSFAQRQPDGSVVGWLERFPAALDTFESLLKSDQTIAGAFLPYDLAVAAAERSHLLPLIFDKLERGQCFDILIAMALNQVAKGTLFKDPSGGALRKPPKKDGTPGAPTRRYSLETVHWLLTGQADAKENDEYRTRYGEFDLLPTEEWPIEARLYPIDDARNTLVDALILEREGVNLGNVQGKTWTHQTHNMRASFAMHLASAWGIRTDGPRLAKLEAEVTARVAANDAKFKALGLIRPDGTENRSEVKKRIALAYGAVPGTKHDQCEGTGKVKSPTTGKPINCKGCDSTGLILPPSVKRTPTGGISTDRDTLEESADPVLEDFGEAGLDDKSINTYLPVLKEGVDYPINVRGNVLVETGRASYEGVIQLMPRSMGLRECVIPRPGRLFCSTDYNALEMVTLAQTHLYLFGASTLADAINNGRDLHIQLGARMAGVSYEEFKARVKAKNESAKNTRQAAKAGNFGFAGLMGAAKFVLTQRKAKVGGHGSMCRLGGVERVPCGTEKLYEWKGNPCTPVCKACTEFSEQLRNVWLETWSEMKRYFRWVTDHDGIQEGAATMVSVGTGYVRGGVMAASGANHHFQHLAAYGAKHALWKLSKAAYVDYSSAFCGSRPVIFAHDEVIAEVPIETAHEAGYEQARLMVEAMREFTPDVKVVAVPALMDRWYKSAEPAFDPVTKRLIPWYPNAEYDAEGVFLGWKKDKAA